MSRRARVYVAVALVLVVAASGPAVRRAQAFFGLDPAAWIVVGQMASVVSNLMALRDTMMRIRDEALSSYRGLVDPIDDFAGQMRRALGGGASIDFSAFGGTDPRTLALEDCALVPPEDLASTPCVPRCPAGAGHRVYGPSRHRSGRRRLARGVARRARGRVRRAARRSRSPRPARGGGDGGDCAVPGVRDDAGGRGPPRRRGVPGLAYLDRGGAGGVAAASGRFGRSAEHGRLPRNRCGRFGPGGLRVARPAPLAPDRGDAGAGQHRRAAAQARCGGRGPRAPGARAGPDGAGARGGVPSRAAPGPGVARPGARHGGGGGRTC